MFHKNLKYALISLTLIGVAGCNQRTILIHPQTRVVVPQVEPIVQQPVIREEILINKNPNLGERIDVPKNNASVATAENTNGGHVYANVDSEMERASSVPTEIKNTIIERMPFPVGEYNRLSKRGRSTVSGSIYLENSHNSQKVMGKKVKLYLNPVTSYSEQWYQESYLGGYKMSKTDKRIYNYLKFTMSNGSGKFNFFGVPRGDYYLVGTIKCAKECGFSKSTTTRLVKRVSVGSGVTNVQLMKNVP
jgi:hypothetical protein